MIPESGRSTGEGTAYPLQYFWASLVAQRVKNPPAMQETWFDRGLGKHSGERKGFSLQYSALENSVDCIVHAVTKTGTGLSDFHLAYFRTQFTTSMRLVQNLILNSNNVTALSPNNIQAPNTLIFYVKKKRLTFIDHLLHDQSFWPL